MPPAVVVAVLVSAGSWLGLRAPGLAASALLVAALLAAAGLAARACALRAPARSALLLALCPAALALAGWREAARAWDPLAGCDGAVVALTGRLASPRRSGSLDERWPLRLEQAAVVRGRCWRAWPAAAGASVMVRIRCPRRPPGTAPWPPLARWGQAVSVVGVLEAPPAPRAPGGFDYRAWLARRGIFHLVDAADAQGVSVLAGRPLPLPLDLAARLRSALEDGVDAWLPYPQSALLRGIVLGDSHALPAGESGALRAVGASHVVAAAGLNVALLILFVGTVAGAAGARPSAAAVLCVPVIVVYALLVGCTPSIVRAALMGGLAQLGLSLRRQTEAAALLGAAVTAMVLWDANVLLEPGFQMSVACVVGIQLLSRPVERKLAFLPRVVRSTAAVTVAAQVAVAPLCAVDFGDFSLTAVAANVVLVPLCEAALGLGLGLGCLGSVAPAAVARPLAVLLYGLLEAIMRTADWMARLPGSGVAVHAPAPLFLAVYYAVLAAAWKHSCRPRPLISRPRSCSRREGRV